MSVSSYLPLPQEVRDPLLKLGVHLVFSPISGFFVHCSIIISIARLTLHCVFCKSAAYESRNKMQQQWKAIHEPYFKQLNIVIYVLGILSSLSLNRG